MARDLYPHLVVLVDTEPFYHDLIRRYNSLGKDCNQERLEIRKEIAQRCEGMSKWLVEHGYQCGRDYQQTSSGYRFASEPLVTMFKLAWG